MTWRLTNQAGTQIVVCRLVTFLSLACFTSAQAYYPNLGDRANEIQAPTLDTGAWINIDDFLGQWLLLDFGASSCGPCIKQLPAFATATQPYTSASELQVLMVCLDKSDAAPGFLELMNASPLQCPVLAGNGSPLIVGLELQPPRVSPLAMDWSIRSLPSSFLVNPQGVIVARNLKTVDLDATLAYFLDRPIAEPPIGMRTVCIFSKDGPSELRLELSSPQKKPLKVRVDYTLVSGNYAEIGGHRVIDRKTMTRFEPAGNLPEFEQEISFQDCTETIVVVPIALGETIGIDYTASVMLPDSNLVHEGGLWQKRIGHYYLDLPGFSY